MKILRDLEEKYREVCQIRLRLSRRFMSIFQAFQQMDEYEKSRAEDVLRMEKIDSKSTDLAQRIKDRLRVIQSDSDERHLNPASFSRDILSVLISDKETALIEGKVKDAVNMIDAFAKFEIDHLMENLLEDISKQFQPTLAIVDAIEPRRR